MTQGPVVDPAPSGPASPARRAILVASLAGFGATAATAATAAWDPPAAMKEEATAFLARWAALIEGERYGEAYALLSVAAKSRSSPAQWAAREHRFRVRAGASTSRVLRRIFWSNDPPQASPGVYAVATYDGTFEKVGASFEVVALHRPPGSSDFTVLRTQRTVLADEKEKALHERKIWLIAHPR